MSTSMDMFVERFADGQWQCVAPPSEDGSALETIPTGPFSHAWDKDRAEWQCAWRLKDRLEWYGLYQNYNTMAVLAGVRNYIEVEPVPRQYGICDLSPELRLIREHCWESVSGVAVLLSDVKQYDYDQLVRRSPNEERCPLRERMREFLGDVLPKIEAAVTGTTPDKVRLVLRFD